MSFSRRARGAIAVGLALLFAALIAFPIVRMSGLAASLAMFAVLVIIFEVAVNWDAVTRGSRTMIGVPTDTTIGIALPGPEWCRPRLRLPALEDAGCGCGPRARTSSPPARPGLDPRDRAIAFLLSGFIIGIGGSSTPSSRARSRRTTSTSTSPF